MDVDSSGGIVESNVSGLDGPVDNALELMDKLANTSHVRRVFIAMHSDIGWGAMKPIPIHPH